MSIPICNVHNRPMREGKFGYYCAQKMPDGTWCKEKVKQTEPATAAPTPATEAQINERWAPVGQTSKTTLAVAALDFAATIYAGSGDAGADAALDLASKALGIFSLEEGVS